MENQIQMNLFTCINLADGTQMNFRSECVGTAGDAEVVTITLEGMRFDLHEFARTHSDMHIGWRYSAHDGLTVLSVPVHHIAEMYIRHGRRYASRRRKQVNQDAE